MSQRATTKHLVPELGDTADTYAHDHAGKGGAQINHAATLGAGTNTHEQIDIHISGSVTASAVITDHAVVRGDGGSRGVQSSSVIIDDSGNLLVGTDSDDAQLTQTLRVDGSIGGVNYTAGAAGFVMAINRARGNQASPGALQSGDNIFVFRNFGHDGTSWAASTRASFTSRADENWGTTAHGTRWEFYTTPRGSTTIAENLRLDGDGALRIGTGAIPTGGGKSMLVMSQASGNPSGIGSNTAGLIAKDSGGTCELYAWDEAGNVTLLSPHSKNAPDIMYDDVKGIETVRESINLYTGKIEWTNETRKNVYLQALVNGSPIANPQPFHMFETFEQYNQRTGDNLVIQDWDANQEAIRLARLSEIAEWENLNLEGNLDLQKKPEIYKKKKNPFTNTK